MPSLVSCCKNLPWPVFMFPVVILTNLPTIAVAKNDNYVVVEPGPACSIIVGKLNVRSFHMLLPASRIADLATSNSIVNIHICECLLSPGDPQKCAIDAVSKNVLPVKIDPAEQTQLAGQIFIKVDDPSDFAKLYAALTTLYPHEPLPAAWAILHRAVKERPSVARSSAGGISPPKGPSNPPTLPPSPPSASMLGDEDKKKKQCELETNVCINPASGAPSAEFEVKCKGFPTIVFSTDIKAGIKVGPVEVSVSAEEINEH